MGPADLHGDAAHLLPDTDSPAVGHFIGSVQLFSGRVLFIRFPLPVES